MPTQPVYDHETEVVWEQDPSDLKYLREFEVRTRKREGLPKNKAERYTLYGYTNVSSCAPTGPDGCVRKRIFVLKPKDAGGPENEGEYWKGPNTPSEAVEIESIVAGQPSTKMNP